MTELVTALFTLIVLFALAGVAATAYLWVLFAKDVRHHRTLVPPARPGYLTFTMALASTLVMLPSLWIGSLVLYRLLTGESVPPNTLPVTSLAIAILMSVPLVLAGRMVYLRWRTAPTKQLEAGSTKIIETTAPSTITITPDGEDAKYETAPPPPESPSTSTEPADDDASLRSPR